MSVDVGTRLGSLEIIALLGKGGMGEVYRARDAKLKRDVAIKILPNEFSCDAERVSRFQREAEVLASLNHPNIAAIHDLVQSGQMRFLVMELVEGETVADLIARGPIPLEESLDLATQIAEALEAAHEKGIIHRDLKPANVIITPDGRVKVLDFGLAKIRESSNVPQQLSNSPTLSSLQTAGGVILGTAAYMSPEQTRGKNVDQRSDVWSFACILYEMLTGRQAFPNGETVSDTIAGILAREPDWQALPAGTPPAIRKLLERCLRKEARRRLHDIADARIEIEEARNERTATAILPIAPVPSRRRDFVLGALAMLVFMTVAVLILWFRSPLSSAPVDATVRFDVFLPQGATNPGAPQLSPDGRKLAFPATSGQRLIWIRLLDSSTVEPLPGTEGTTGNIFWSADSQSIGFFAEGKLKTVAATGGPPQFLCDLPTPNGASWNREGVILLAAAGSGGQNLGTGGPLLRVSAAGGKPAPLTELDTSRKERFHILPSFLPDGRHYFYLAVSEDPQDRAAYIATLDSKERHPLPGISSEVKYAPSGHVIFIRDGALMAQPFDVHRLELSGEAFPVVDALAATTALTGQYSVSMTGNLAYRSVTSQSTNNSQLDDNSELAWFDRSGKQIELVGPSGQYGGIALSPDGKSVAFRRASDIWVRDIEKGRDSRLTSHPAMETFPVWSPDGGTIAFQSNRDGLLNLYARAVGVVGEDKLVLKSEIGIVPGDWSRDGRYIVFNGPRLGRAPNDIWALPLSGDGKARRLTETPFQKYAVRISPYGNWIAFLSKESEPDRYQLYIQSFPAPGAMQQVSTNGAYQPHWSADGKELFYLAPDTTLMAVSVRSTASSVVVGTPTPLFRAPIAISRLGGKDYDVSSDGRFLFSVTGVTSAPSPPTPITVILNWPAGLKK